MKILVTGSAGFIGFHLCNYLLKNKKYNVFGIDSLDNYYDINLKKNRLKILKKFKNFRFSKMDITNKKKLEKNFTSLKYNCVINLAAQAGVRYSITNPTKYLQSNIIGFFNILEMCKLIKVKHLIYASTSSVYGKSDKYPLKESFNTDKPLSFYAASKKCNEILAYSYSNLHKLPCTGLRFFTVYGPWGRPDMSLFKFTTNILKSKKIDLFNNGYHIRDFTNVLDVVKSIDKLITKPSKNKIPYEIFNIGSNNPKSLKNYVDIIEKNLNIKSKIRYKPLQKGDVIKTHANVNKLINYINYRPLIKIEKGIFEFINWFKSYYK